MTKFLPLISAAFLAVSTLPSLAQDSGTTEGESSAETGLTVGTEVSLEPYIKEEIGDWKLRCFPLEDGTENCELHQILFDLSGAAIVEYNFFRLENPSTEEGQAVAGATVIVPLGTLLESRLAITVDEEKARRYPFAYCTQLGCIARIGLTAEDIEQYKAGTTAFVALRPAFGNGQVVRVPMSLIGFTAGHEKASALGN